MPAADSHNNSGDREGEQGQGGKHGENPRPPRPCRPGNGGELILAATPAPPGQQDQHASKNKARCGNNDHAHDGGHRLGGSR
ncbi:MAG TPA: hypothetical protein DHU96_34245 [Actinobacteria bacterium]|nr:hypothetical protein [Actinomycetota bacterium]